MKTQNAVPYEWPELKSETINGCRFYTTPNGEKYPSITTVIGQQPGKTHSLQEWKDRVGEAQANLISRRAAARGTAFHHICEDYLDGIEHFDTKLEEHHKKKNFLAYCMFKEMQPYLDSKVNKVLLQEQPMYSERFGVAGRCDLIGVYDSELAVVDFKTTTRMKKEEWIEDYFVQCSAYASMYEEHMKVGIDKVVVMMVAEDGEVNIFEKKTVDYLDKLQTIMNEWYDNFVYKVGIA